MQHSEPLNLKALASLLTPHAAMASEMDELVLFLSAPSPNVKKAAVEIVQGLTGTEDGIKSLASKSAMLIPPLLGLVGEKQEVSQLAAGCLVNLSQDTKIAEQLIAAGAIEKVMELLGKVDQGFNRLLVMLLVNLSQLEIGATRLLQVESEGKFEGVYVTRLVRFFTRRSDTDEGVDEYEHVAAVLVNITRLEPGRRLLLDSKKGLLRVLLRQIDSKSLVRRKGVVGTVRNCCFEAERNLLSLLSCSQFLWTALLLPLAGKRVYDKDETSKMPPELANPLGYEREPEVDPQVRIEALDALYLLVMQEGGRRALWAVNGPKILQTGYEDEEDVQVMDAYERLGSLLIGESGTQSEQSVENM
ncbi:hypothetical protein O6H91_02G151000 [Diphasiastrum complanatum]|uniref:Uncharacterized protein n=1 Tax=Diphasiastrum complanatum TaxID=34168 RepID=A0ACC2ELQ2_DIPCM|nr:hypothetical protein O6H91_02G151000 [Diphasiastrum complanatum]